jgi:hypothetical protein
MLIPRIRIRNTALISYLFCRNSSIVFASKPESNHICPVIREASPQPKKKPAAPKPKKKAIESDGEESDAYPAKTNGNGVTNGKKAAADGGVTNGKKAADDDDDDFMIVSDSDSEGESHGGRYTANKKGEYIDTAT